MFSPHHRVHHRLRHIRQRVLLLPWPLLFILSLLLLLALVALAALASHDMRTRITGALPVINADAAAASTSSSLSSSSSSGSFAYFTLLCDDVMLESTLILAASLRAVRSQHPFVVLALPSLTPAARDQLLSAHSGVSRVIETSQLDYPFKVASSAAFMNKACRYSKLHLWEQVQYEKIVYLDADVMMLKNCDALFAEEELSAVADLGGVYNTGVMVIQPSLATYAEMSALYMTAPSYNHGDQGYFNWFFGEHRVPSSIRSLPPQYNVVAKYQDYSIWEKMKSEARVFHYTSETKPWSFHYEYHSAWQRNMEGQFFAKWREMATRVQETLNHRPPHDLSAFALPLPDGVKFCGEARTTSASIDCAAPWLHKKQKSDKYTIVIHTSPSEDGDDDPDGALLFALVREYIKSKALDRIIIASHANRTDFSLITAMRHKSVLVLPASSPFSYNHLYAAHAHIRTRPVFITRSSVRSLSSAELDEAHQVWQQQQLRVVGFFPAPLPSAAAASYALLLSTGLFVDSWLLSVYSCLLPPQLLAYVNLQHSSYVADLVFAAMVSGLTALPPLAVESASGAVISAPPLPTEAAYYAPQHIRQFFGERLTLISTKQMITAIRRVLSSEARW